MPEPSRRPFDPRLARLPAVRVSLAASVALGLVSTAAVVAQAVGLAHLLAGAMPGLHGPGANAGDRARWFVLLGAGFAVRALVALASEVVVASGASAAKAALRARLVTATVFGTTGRSAGLNGAAANGPVQNGRAPNGPAPNAGLAPSGPAPSGPVATTPGGVATLAGPGLDALDIYIGRCLPDFVLAAAAPLALLIAVGVIDWVSALVIAVVLALFPVFGALVGRASLSLGAEHWRRVEALGNCVADVFQGMPVLRAFGRSTAQRERVAKLNQALGRSSTKALRVAFLSALVLDELGSLSVALVAVPLGLRLLSGTVSLSAALAVLAIAPEVFVPLRRASAEFHESTQGLAAAAKVLEVVVGTEVAAAGGGERQPVRGPAKRAAPDPRDVPVGLRSVSVVLPGRAKPVLLGADLDIQPGETVALVGPSGAGKSTIVSLLAGFLSPSEGSVTAGAVDLRDIDLCRWRSFITYLPEHPTVLAATLADNLRLASPGASDEDLLQALAEAGAPALAAGLPGGLGARIGDGGQPLSAGELQRVALARVMLRPASLYLLDEPTVHLDEASEQSALAGLRRAIGTASALIVSHRPAVAEAAARVLTLHEGRIVELPRRDIGERLGEPDLGERDLGEPDLGEAVRV